MPYVICPGGRVRPTRFSELCCDLPSRSSSSLSRRPPQAGGGRLYRRADFSAGAVERLSANFRNGMIQTYLRDQSARDAALSLVRMELVA